MRRFRPSGTPRYPKLYQFLEKLKTWGRTDRNSLVNQKKTRRQAEKRTHRQRSRRPGRCQEAKESKGNEGNKKAHQKRGGTKRSRTTPKATPQGQRRSRGEKNKQRKEGTEPEARGETKQTRGPPRAGLPAQDGWPRTRQLSATCLAGSPPHQHKPRSKQTKTRKQQSEQFQAITI